jgi:hypothetical protein
MTETHDDKLAHMEELISRADKAAHLGKRGVARECIRAARAIAEEMEQEFDAAAQGRQQ